MICPLGRFCRFLANKLFCCVQVLSFSIFYSQFLHFPLHFSFMLSILRLYHPSSRLFLIASFFTVFYLFPHSFYSFSHLFFPSSETAFFYLLRTLNVRCFLDSVFPFILFTFSFSFPFFLPSHYFFLHGFLSLMIPISYSIFLHSSPSFAFFLSSFNSHSLILFLFFHIFLLYSFIFSFHFFIFYFFFHSFNVLFL